MSISVKYVPTNTRLAFVAGVMLMLDPEEGMSE